MAARHYKDLASGKDTPEADAAAMRLATFIEHGIALFEALGQQKKGGRRG